ncbi:unnamed protein product, partial [Discosporangium mesarthrocarpum]
PNILLVVVDDLGWGDVGFHEPTFSTPNMNIMVSEGVELASFYASSTCTPSRAQLMTGRYNFRTGMQDSVLHITEPRGVPLKERFLGEKLRDVGYSTAHVGKWHLGMYTAAYSPLQRGFERHYGILTGGGGHYTHVSVSQPFTPRDGGSERIFSGVNIVEDGEVSPDNFTPRHTTELYTTKAAEYVQAMAATGDPWFLYLSYQAVHDPIETDKIWYTGNSCEGIGEEMNGDVGVDPDVDWNNRRILCGMMAQVDNGLGQLRALLSHLGEWDNTVLFFMSDNGGVLAHGSMNYPFRGGKGDYWEGGVHVPAFVSGGYIASALASGGVEPYAYSHLVHITDIHTTALSLAGITNDKGVGRGESSNDLDGVDLWGPLVTNGGAARESLVINVNSPNFGESGAVRWGDFKLICNPEPSEAGVYNRVRASLVEQ